jgi:hypothetical protein|tara:strand:+ start:405 stop:527 length:123 start_codon:yes stop_codon:yes gene_type:complete
MEMLDQLKEIWRRINARIIATPNEMHGIILLLILITLILK